MYAKYVRFGYGPWKKLEDGGSMVPLYEACVRMVRANYCGDGVAATIDGMRISPYDDGGVRNSAPLENLEFEAGCRPRGRFAFAVRE
ncbi:MAG: ADYC domain-containing protein [Luteimonas sp.]